METKGDGGTLPKGGVRPRPEPEGGEAFKAIRRAARTVDSVDPVAQMERDLEEIIEDGLRASQRGYFTPDEDERVLTQFGRYLRTRNILYGTILEMEMLMRPGFPDRVRVGSAMVALCAATLLIRSGEFIISYKSMKVVTRKLDQGEPRYGIPRKQFTKIYSALTNTFNVYRFHQAVRFVRERWPEVEELGKDPELAPIFAQLSKEHPNSELPPKRLYALNRLGYFRYSLARRNRSTLQNVGFSVFQMLGRMISNVRFTFRKKRVTAEIRERVLELLKPGDVFITRHDDAMSNYFLPGFWPHAALYIGLADERRGLGVEMTSERWERSGGTIRLLEARKDGVLFRTLRETLNVDSFVVVRPRLAREDLAEALTRAITHEGKAYNFEFDFTRGDRLACTELIYRSYHATGEIQFKLSRRLRRINLSAEDILDHAIGGDGFDVVAMFGAKGMPFLVGEEARVALATTYRSGARAPLNEGEEEELADETLPDAPSATV